MYRNSFPIIKKVWDELIKCLIILLLIQGNSFLFNLNAQVNEAENEILQAYELRISGKTDEARELLLAVLEKDSTNAMANFEMARTLPDDQRGEYYEKATLYDPDNPMYEFYKANHQMLGAYVAMMKNNQEEAGYKVKECCNTLKHVLEIYPDCKESMLFLVDLYGSLPEDMGGNKEEAKKYVENLKNTDPFYAAQGELILSAGEINAVEFWQDYIEKNGESQEVMIKLGKEELMNDEIEKATECFQKIMAEDPTQKQLYLHIARAHLYRAMRGGPDSDQEIARIKENINNYLELEDYKPAAVEAWCYGWLSTIAQRTGNQEEGQKYMQMAQELMPNYSRATALPQVDDPPNVIAYHYSSYFSPF
jgi:hypothetical protein